MSSNLTAPNEVLENALNQYISTVSALQTKLGRIASSEKEVAGNLGRAAAALRSISAVKPLDTSSS